MTEDLTIVAAYEPTDAVRRWPSVSISSLAESARIEIPCPDDASARALLAEIDRQSLVTVEDRIPELE